VIVNAEGCEQAREENVSLVILWFGLWKNGTSMYVPGWVKRDYKKEFSTKAGFGKYLRNIFLKH
jgi:hypothetical protein